MATLYARPEARRRRAQTVARVRAYQQRRRDEHGRFVRDVVDEPRCEMLCVRLTVAELSAIEDRAAARDVTVTQLIVDAVRAYGRGRATNARTFDRHGIGL